MKTLISTEIPKQYANPSTLTSTFFVSISTRQYGPFSSSSLAREIRNNPKQKQTSLQIRYLNGMLFVQKCEIRYVSTRTYAVSENVSSSARISLIFLMSKLFCKKSVLLISNNTFSQSNSSRPVLKIFQFYFRIFR